MRQLGPYELHEELARGGFGVVYRAQHRELGREVALKLLHGGASAVQQRRFLREGQALAKLQHPNVVRVITAGQDRGVPYLALELVSGRTLEELLEREGPLPAEEALRLTRGVVEGLAAAHAADVLHRDLKPANVLLDAHGEPRVADFGLTRRSALSESQTQLTEAGQMLGTLGYAAPELFRGDQEQVGPPSDVYGVGAILFALLTGEGPWAGADLGQALQRLSAPPRPPSALRADIPPPLDALCLRCLAEAPAARPSLSELRAELGGLAAGGLYARPRTTRFALATCALGLTAAGVLLATSPARETLPASPSPSLSATPPTSPTAPPGLLPRRRVLIDLRSPVQVPPALWDLDEDGVLDLLLTPTTGHARDNRARLVAVSGADGAVLWERDDFLNQWAGAELQTAGSPRSPAVVIARVDDGRQELVWLDPASGAEVHVEMLHPAPVPKPPLRPAPLDRAGTGAQGYAVVIERPQRPPLVGLAGGEQTGPVQVPALPSERSDYGLRVAPLFLDDDEAPGALLWAHDGHFVVHQLPSGELRGDVAPSRDAHFRGAELIPGGILPEGVLVAWRLRAPDATELALIDPATSRAVWQRKVAAGRVHEGGVALDEPRPGEPELLVATSLGELLRLDARTGRTLASRHVRQRDLARPIAFRHGGQRWIAVGAGTHHHEPDDELVVLDPDLNEVWRTGLSGFYWLAAGDLDGDGDDELLACDEGAIVVYRPELP